MTFVQFEFLVFFALVLALYWGIRSRRAQNALLVVASLVFYGWVHWWFVGLLAFSTLLDFYVGIAMADRPKHKRLLLTVSMCGNLGLLGAFKYLDFFIENVGAVLTALGFGYSPQTLGIFLPVGISFFTFQTMSYTFDIYRGKLTPRRDLLDYATFVTMFPQLVAGPVERARNLLPQVEQVRVFSHERFRSGFSLALWGAVKKLLVADTVAMYVDKVFAMPEPSAPLIAAATFGFAIQILADFSAYTDIARGTARMLGFELMENFRSPYLATNPSDFWKRWHISFSSWIHEYVYVPFCGRRRTGSRRLAATYAALLLSGLWHGASWNFVLWGAYHASLLAGYRLAGSVVPKSVSQHPLLRPAKILLMFLFTLGGWLLFREQDFSRLLLYASLPWELGSTVYSAAFAALLTVSVSGAVFLALALVVNHFVIPRLRERAVWPLFEGLFWACAIAVIFLFAREAADEFIYFQF